VEISWCVKGKEPWTLLLTPRGRRAPVDDQAHPASACVHASWLSVCQRFLLLAQGVDVIPLPEQSACPQAKKSRRAARRIQH
jgi:hypothetical protein